MRKHKLFISLSLALIFMMSTVMGASAESIDTSAKVIGNNENNITYSGIIELERSDFDKIFESDGPVYLGDGLWAEELTYEEMAQQIAKNRNVSEKYVRSLLSERSSEPNYYYTHFYQQFEVGDTGWFPQIDFYIKCEGIYRDFIKVEDLNLIRSYNYISKQFTGKLQAKVEDVKSIYWVINGDFYNNGTTKQSFSGGVSASDYATLSFSIESQNNHFGYVYKTGNLRNR
ncbi:MULTISPECIES: hypothetical protein [Paenibacillus]|uniref:Deacetylase PdaC domain-containing protein n=1 Tax=Paenibacillus vini TaxID=1476024 RepID=A0ABQ4MC92_9BACL|nr:MULTISPECIES: hypothetical protein [Paenibacillus]MBQ4898270.1 hypothetical protein [Paenibacillus sp. Marseille-P2973]MDN4071261.1 hypothetical protein [Paenibacillus vini]GIP53595.1 hypothetical protein J42TS3_26300 [Paenibacillus vini]